MSKSWLTRAMLAGLTGVGLASCTLISGIGDLDTVDSIDAALDRAAPVSNDGSNHSDGSSNGGGGDGDSSFVDSGPLADAPILGDPDATVIEACSPTGCLPFPSGFQLVAYGSATAACPSGYTNATTLLTNPALSAGACSCQCTVTDPGNCAQTADIPSTFGNIEAGSACPGAGSTYSGGCATDGYMGPFGGSSNIAFSPVKSGPFGAGPCTPSAKTDTSKVAGTSVRVCSAGTIPACADKVCPADPGGTYLACIASNGDVACPSGMIKHLAGTTPSFTCDGSGCTCGAETAGCFGSGKMLFYGNGGCNGAPGAALTADGKCRAAPDINKTFFSHKYVPDPPLNPACPPQGSATPSAVSLSSLLTVCCTK